MANHPFTLNFMGDTMLGRLIDQMFPTHIDEPDEAQLADSFRNANVGLMHYGPKSPWGNTLPLLHAADINILNLETSATTHPTKWRNKVFNYRMHPENIDALHAAKISFVGLANNHTLDFSEPGLLETVQTVKNAGIAFAGAGVTQDEATRPAILQLSSSDGASNHEIHIWAASDHPEDWAGVPTFHFIDYTQRTRRRLKDLLMKQVSKTPSLKIFSVHWGPNYSWLPAQEIQDLAHFLIDECGMDLIHGHSSHHVQGVEIYKSKLIIYGCGDFVDDYALVAKYRNDLSAIWQITVEETSQDTEGKRLKLKTLQIYPTKIERFAARRLAPEETDFSWTRHKIADLSRELGTMLDPDGTGEACLRLDLS